MRFLPTKTKELFFFQRHNLRSEQTVSTGKEKNYPIPSRDDDQNVKRESHCKLMINKMLVTMAEAVYDGIHKATLHEKTKRMNGLF